MKTSIGMASLIQIIIVLLLLFTSYLCISINYTAAYKVANSIILQIQQDNGVKPTNIANVLAETKYTSQSECPTGWVPISGSSRSYTTKGHYCVKKESVSAGSTELPAIDYYRVIVFYKIDMPLIRNLNFNVKAETVNIYDSSDEVSL